jgi:hypothetical protein
VTTLLRILAGPDFTVTLTGSDDVAVGGVIANGGVPLVLVPIGANAAIALLAFAIVRVDVPLPV